MDAFHHVTPPQLQTQQKPRVTEAQHNAEKHFLFKICIREQMKLWTERYMGPHWN